MGVRLERPKYNQIFFITEAKSINVVQSRVKPKQPQQSVEAIAVAFMRRPFTNKQ